MGRDLITTSNLKHFVPLPAGIEARSPDEFLCNLYGSRRVGFPRTRLADCVRRWEEYFPEAEVTDYEPLIAAMQNDP